MTNGGLRAFGNSENMVQVVKMELTERDERLQEREALMGQSETELAEQDQRLQVWETGLAKRSERL